MSSSSSEDDCDVTLLMEALDGDFVRGNLYGSDKHRQNDAQIIPKSLRNKENEEEALFNGLDVSSGFRQHVAKHLVRILDERLKERFSERKPTDVHIQRKRRGGIRLFSASDCCIKKVKEETHLSLPQKRFLNITKRADVEEKDLQAIVVDGEYILSKKDTICWSKRSKAAIFYYKACDNGVLYKIE